MVIKLSGVNYDDIKSEDMVLVDDLMTGETIEGQYMSSSDTICT